MGLYQLRKNNHAQIVFQKLRKQRGEDPLWDKDQKLMVLAASCCLIWIGLIILIHVIWL